MRTDGQLWLLWVFREDLHSHPPPPLKRCYLSRPRILIDWWILSRAPLLSCASNLSPHPTCEYAWISDATRLQLVMVCERRRPKNRVGKYCEELVPIPGRFASWAEGEVGTRKVGTRRLVTILVIRIMRADTGHRLLAKTTIVCVFESRQQ